MSVSSSVTSAVTSVDWTLVAGAVGTFIAAIWASLKGLQRGKEKVESGSSSMTSIVGGAIMDNATMKELTEALRENTAATRDNTRELQRHNDIVVMIGRPKD